jgi:chromosome segregation ATPase
MPIFAKHTDAQFRALERELAHTQKQLATIQTDLTTELDTKDAELKKAAETLKSEAQKRSTLEKQLVDIQAQLTRETQNRTTLEKEIAALKTQLAAEQQQRSALDKQLAEVKAKLSTETSAKDAEINKSKDLQEENDLLLAQLHQMQEELERYYLNNKDLEAAASEATTTLRVARQSLVNTLIDIRGFALPPLPKPTPTGSKVVKLPERLSPPKAAAKKPTQRTSARKSSRSK